MTEPVSTSNGLDLFKKIKVLNELLWEYRADLPSVQQWLRNFSGSHTLQDAEQRHALYLLSRFLYYGSPEIRVLLRSMFQDLVRHPLTIKARTSVSDPNDFDRIHQAFETELASTRFIGLGNPAESSTHILYDFRLANSLPIEYFLVFHELFSGALNAKDTEWADPGVTRIIFIDDFCGTGTQATDVASKYLPVVRQAALRSQIVIEVWYLTMLGTTAGLARVRAAGRFDCVSAVSELDDTYRAFGPDSQLFMNPPPGIEATVAEEVSRHYGGTLVPDHPLGYENSQLLLGFSHNVPDNTLPIFWAGASPGHPWSPIFPRISKLSVAGGAL
ncbi:MAG: hypothetical protein OXC94_08195 [Chloroflexi bacterium]|nr:hypothetical protein [Chloroflexota bacterium]